VCIYYRRYCITMSFETVFSRVVQMNIKRQNLNPIILQKTHPNPKVEIGIPFIKSNWIVNDNSYKEGGDHIKDNKQSENKLENKQFVPSWNRQSYEVAANEDEPSVEVVATEDEPSVEVVATEDETSVEVAATEDETSVEVAATEDETSVEVAATEDETSVEVAATEDETSVEVVANEDEPLNKLEKKPFVPSWKRGVVNAHANNSETPQNTELEHDDANNSEHLDDLENKPFVPSWKR